MKLRNPQNGSTNDHWATPNCILSWVRHEFGDFYDPCPLHGVDGLDYAKPWGKVNFINPPYNLKDKVQFTKRAIFEASQGKTCILLVPTCTDTKLFLDIWNSAHHIYFVSPRVKFSGTNTKGQFVNDKAGQSGSMLVVMKGPRSHTTICDVLLLPNDQSSEYFND